MAAKDEDRAARYVATVRPAMSAGRYVRPDAQGGSEYERPNTEEGEAAEQAAARAGAEAVAAATEAPSLAKARTARRARKKAAKKRRVQRATEKKERGPNGGEPEESPTPADERQREERIRNAVAARLELGERRRQRLGSDGAGAVAVSEKVRVSLVQRRQGPVLATLDGDGSAGAVEADDGLPTAMLEVAGGSRQVKLDSGARYTVAGTDWMERGDKQAGRAPVDYVEGIGGFLLDVLGVWTFKMVNIFGQTIEVEACIVDGCTSEFLLGVDFMRAHEATMDFSKNEVRYDQGETRVVIPFRTFDKGGRTRVAAVRMVERARLARRTVTPMQVSVTAKDGEKGIFVPHGNCGTVMLATTVTEARNGKAWVPVINAGGGRAKLPPKKELGTWIPLDEDMQVMSLNGKPRSECKSLPE